MKTRTAYQTAKANALQKLRNYSQVIKGLHSKTDRAGIRMQINDQADAISKDLPPSMADHERERITKALHDLAGRLHPKD